LGIPQTYQLVVPEVPVYSYPPENPEWPRMFPTVEIYGLNADIPKMVRLLDIETPGF
jgi:hypothetical protein